MSTARTLQGGWVPRHSIPRGANGRGLCRWCNLEVPPRRFTFCSAYCVHEWRLRTQPRYLREQVYARDRGVCSVCGIDSDVELRRLRRSRGAKRAEQMARWGLKTRLRKSLWDADHIVPVIEGGGSATSPTSVPSACAATALPPRLCANASAAPRSPPRLPPTVASIHRPQRIVILSAAKDLLLRASEKACADLLCEGVGSAVERYLRTSAIRTRRRIVAIAPMLRVFTMSLLLLACTSLTHAQQKASPYPASAEHPSPAWFVDVAAKAGITVRNVNGSATNKKYIVESTGSGVAILDYDRDGWQDIFLVNGTELNATTKATAPSNHLFRNNHDGTFTDEGANAGAAFNEDGREQAGMGATAADFDGDGHIDLFKTNFSDDTSTLYHANGDGTFTDVTRAGGLGINTDALGWGVAFADVDNDGRPDLLVVNGHIYPEVESAKLGATFREPRFLYWNAGGGKFSDLSKQSGPGLTDPLSGRGLAVADLWNDGRMSAVVNNLDDRPLLLVNQAANRDHWLGLRLIGTKSNRDAIGARVTVHAVGHVWVDEVRSGSSYNSSSDLRLHFGLGSADKIDSVLVRWPNGESETFASSATDGIREIREGSGSPVHE